MAPVETRKDIGKTTEAIGEVVSSSATGFTAESWLTYDEDGLPTANRPGFGSFLWAESVDDGTKIIAVVVNVITGPSDSNHKPSALGMTREQLRLEQPHIFALLRTEIAAVTVGYVEGGKHFQHLPPQPPQVHDFVYPASNAEIQAVTEDHDFLRLIATVSAVPPDELIAAAVRHAYRARNEDYQFVVGIGQSLSHLYRDDYDRLLAVLRKIKPA